MDTREFVERNRESWERLEALLSRVRSAGLNQLAPDELRELGLLHRQVSSDLATSRTYHADSRVVGYLNRLALRSHNAVYRAPKERAWTAIRRFIRSIPPTVRRRGGTVAASALIFFVGTLLGAVGTAVDESVGEMVVGTKFVDEIREGQYWIEDITEQIPDSALSGFILTNNLWVSLRIFGLGITGVAAAIDLFRNGAMLGAVLVICAQYGLLPRFAAFVIGHGVIEISAVLMAGAGGFCLFDGWLHPGDRTRLQGLRRGARDGLRLGAAAMPALLIAGPVEGLISTVEAIPGALRMSLGVALGAAYWSWLLLSSRNAPTTDPAS